MAYVPKMLVIGRCIRCGKKLYRGDEMYRCPKCGVLYCPICHKKVYSKCPICQSPLEEY